MSVTSDLSTPAAVGVRTRVARTLSETLRGEMRLHVGGLVGMIVVWSLVSLAYPPLLLPSPGETISALKELLLNDALLSTFGTSMQALLIGLGISIVVGIVMGLFLGAMPKLDRFVSPYLDALYVTPHVMLIPLFIIWFGIGATSRVAYIILAAYFPVVVNTLVGVRTTRGDVEEMALSFGATRMNMLRRVYLPGSVPMILAGIRLAIGRGVVAMVTAEMFLAVVGIGYLVISYGNRLQTGHVIALAVFVSLFGVAATRAVAWVGARIAPWSEIKG